MPLTVRDCQKIVKSVADMAVIAGWYSKSVLDHRIFRGEAKHDWPLLPKVDREGFGKWLIVNESSAEAMLDARSWEMQTVAQFEMRAAGLVNPAPKLAIEWLVLAQHHGLVTRLLDWTESALVALYFAVEESQTTNIDSIVYALAPQKLPFVKGHENPFAISHVGRYYPRHINPRITAQASLFTVHPAKVDFDSALWGDADLQQIRVPGKSRPLIRRQLDVLGINRFTLFPDLTGLARWSNMHWGEGDAASKENDPQP